MVAYVFPGQGSQQKGMGGTLFDEFKELTAKADAILGYSIKELCMEDLKNQLGQTQFTQPALYVVNALSYLKKIKDTGKKPDYVAGHSLGEYDALFAAGAFDFETGLRLVQKRGEMMSKATGGGMAAVVGFTEEQIREVFEKNNLNTIDIANFNTPTQIVISGSKAEIERAKPYFEAAGVRNYIVLNVSGAFHSRYMTESSNQFGEFLNQFTISQLEIPVISNVTARPYKKKDLKKNMIEQINHSVRWTETVRYLMGKGEIEITQVGPGTVLTGLVKTIQRDAQPLIVNDEEDTDVEEVTKDVAAPSEEVVAPANASEEKCACESKLGAITASSLGNADFKRDYNLKYAYLTGAMYKGVASKEIVVKMGKAGMMGFLGTGGMEFSQVEEAIQYIQRELKDGGAYGMNLLYYPTDPQKEETMIDLYFKYGVRNIEASAYMSIVPTIVRYRLKGLKRDSQGGVLIQNHVMAKVSRPEVAEAFLSPAPERIVEKLLSENKITQEEAKLAKEIPMADDLCIEADSGGHTDGGVAYALMPAMIKLRDEMMKKYGYKKLVRVGAAGGIGTPEAAAASFIMGADFILTGSINQCSVEAATSNVVKDLLQQINVQDTEYAPAGDMFEMGAKVQVLKKGLFFPARANKLYELYRQCNSLDEIDEKTKKQLQDKYFKRTFEDIFNESKSFYPASEIEKAERNPKHKMSIVFRWYFGYATRLALAGNEENKVDYQVHCGPALGAFNQWVKGTELENWRNRKVDVMGLKIMNETAELINKKVQAMFCK